jgi:hypothetical protein
MGKRRTPAELQADGYYEIRVVDGVTCALKNFLTTVAVCVGITSACEGRRYCFREASDARAALREYERPREHVSGPWLKCKGIHSGMIVDMPNPNEGEHK